MPPKNVIAFKDEAEAKVLIEEIRKILEEAKNVENWIGGEAKLEAVDIRIAQREVEEIENIMGDLEMMATVTGRLFEQLKKIIEWESQPGSQVHVLERLKEAHDQILAMEKELVKDEEELKEIKKLIKNIRGWDKKLEKRQAAELKGDVNIDKMLKHMDNIVNTISGHLKRTIGSTKLLLMK